MSFNRMTGPRILPKGPKFSDFNPLCSAPDNALKQVQIPSRPPTAKPFVTTSPNGYVKVLLSILY